MSNLENIIAAKDFLKSKKQSSVIKEKENIKKELEDLESGKKSLVLDEDEIFKYSLIGGVSFSVLSVILLSFIFNFSFGSLLSYFVSSLIIVSAILFFVIKFDVIKIKDRKEIKRLKEEVNNTDLFYEINFEQEYASIEVLKKLSKFIGEDKIVELILVKNKYFASNPKDYINAVRSAGEDPLSTDTWEEKITYEDLEKLVQKNYEEEMAK